MTSRFPFPSYPSGWFAVGFSEDLAPGTVRTVHYFGQDIVLFRTNSGEAHALDPFCPHLGAHLGVKSSVVGEHLQCAFHAWKFDGDGRCVHVPMAEKIPPLAKARSWHLREQNHVMFVWYHPDAEDPSFDIPVIEKEGWTEDRTVTWTVRTHPQEVFENTADTSHLPPVHDTEAATILRGPTADNQMLNVLIGFVADGEVVGHPGLKNDVELDVTMRGLGWLVSLTHVPEHKIRARQRIHPTPIDGESCTIRGIVDTRIMEDEAWTTLIAEQMYQAFVFDFARDFPIWENKVYRKPPALSSADGPIGSYRKWASQFYIVPKSGQQLAPIAVPVVGAVLELDRLDELGRPRDGAVVETAAQSTPDSNAVEVDVEAEAAPPKAPVGVVPERVEDLQHYLDTLPYRFVSEASADMDAVFQWRLTGELGQSFHVTIKNQAMQLTIGEHQSPTLAIGMDADDFVKMVNGDLQGPKLFSSGRGTLEGNVMLALKLQSILPA